MLSAKEGIMTEVPIAIATCDIKNLGFIKQVNTSYAKIFGYTKN
jgi:PAS domain-containing protein